MNLIFISGLAIIKMMSPGKCDCFPTSPNQACKVSQIRENMAVVSLIAVGRGGFIVPVKGQVVLSCTMDDPDAPTI